MRAARNMRRPHPTGSDFARTGEAEALEVWERGESEGGVVLLEPGGVSGRVGLLFTLK